MQYLVYRGKKTEKGPFRPSCDYLAKLNLVFKDTITAVPVPDDIAEKLLYDNPRMFIKGVAPGPVPELVESAPEKDEPTVEEKPDIEPDTTTDDPPSVEESLKGLNRKQIADKALEDFGTKINIVGKTLAKMVEAYIEAGTKAAQDAS